MSRRAALALLVSPIVILTLAALSMGYVLVRNDLVAEREALEERWAQLENVMQRRADLIPNLVRTVKGYTEHEERVLVQVTEARAAADRATSRDARVDAEARLSDSLSGLAVVVEHYPALKADLQFRQLMAELAGTENRIATERRRYNEAVRRFNTHIQQVPANVIASASDLDQAATYWETERPLEDPPVVEF
jgi:LemA protein